MNICDTLFDEVKIILYNRKEDDRGTMSVIYDDKQLDMAGITFVTKEQRIYSMPQKGTFFGIHFQLKSHSQDKMIHLLTGQGIDYVIDLRRSSDTYKKWISIKLSAGDNQHIYIPQGFGHAFLSLEDNTTQLFTINEHFYASVNGKYFPANSAINFQQISAVKNQQFIMPHISRGVSPGSVIYSNGRLTS